MEHLTLKNLLLPCTYCHPHPVSLLRLCPQPHTPHPSFILPVHLFHLSPSVFCDAFSLSPLSAPCPSLLPKDGLSFCLFIILEPSHMHSLASVFLTFFICSSCPLFLILPVHLLQEQYKSQVCTIFIPLIIYGGAVAITFILLISTLCTVHNLSGNI